MLILKMYSLLFQNSNLIGYLVFLFAISGSPTKCPNHVMFPEDSPELSHRCAVYRWQKCFFLSPSSSGPLSPEPKAMLLVPQISQNHSWKQLVMYFCGHLFVRVRHSLRMSDWDWNGLFLGSPATSPRMWPTNCLLIGLLLLVKSIYVRQATSLLL